MKFDLFRTAIELGYQPTFLDSDVAITASLPAALARLSRHSLYLARGGGKHCGKTIDGFIHCGHGCDVGGAAWRVMQRVSARHAAFETNFSSFWAPLDASGATAPPHPKMAPPRENVLLNDVLSSECCGFAVYASVQPAGAVQRNESAIGRFLSVPSNRYANKSSPRPHRTRATMPSPCHPPVCTSSANPQRPTHTVTDIYCNDRHWDPLHVPRMHITDTQAHNRHTGT